MNGWDLKPNAFDHPKTKQVPNSSPHCTIVFGVHKNCMLIQQWYLVYLVVPGHLFDAVNDGFARWGSPLVDEDQNDCVL